MVFYFYFTYFKGEPRVLAEPYSINSLQTLVAVTRGLLLRSCMYFSRARLRYSMGRLDFFANYCGETTCSTSDNSTPGKNA